MERVDTVERLFIHFHILYFGNFLQNILVKILAFHRAQKAEPVRIAGEKLFKFVGSRQFAQYIIVGRGFHKSSFIVIQRFQSVQNGTVNICADRRRGRVISGIG